MFQPAIAVNDDYRDVYKRVSLLITLANVLVTIPPLKRC